MALVCVKIGVNPFYPLNLWAIFNSKEKSISNQNIVVFALRMEAVSFYVAERNKRYSVQPDPAIQKFRDCRGV